MTSINIFDIEQSSGIYGPGQRMVIWVQGCLLRCQGCWNSDLWPMDIKKLYTVDDLMEIYARNDLEGVTLIGGEPMHQAERLLEFIIQVKADGGSVVLFTGYEGCELTETAQKALWEKSDIIISGRYVEKLRDLSCQWRGSSNQQLIFNTERYRDYVMDDGNYFEITFGQFGEITLSGFPADNFLKYFKN